MKLKLMKIICDYFESYEVTKNKVLIGKAEHCDLVINHDSISHYHAMIFMDEKGQLTVQDLQSVNGTFVNGQRCTMPSLLNDEDSLTFGQVHCTLLSSEETIKVESTDQEVIKVQTEEKIYVPEKFHEDQVLIDDEYCDIVFKDEDFKPLSTSPLSQFQYDQSAYIPTDELEDSFDILRPNHGHCIQVTTLSSGHILEQYYLPLKDMNYSATGKPGKGHIYLDILEENIQDFIQVQGQEITIKELDGFKQSATSLRTDDQSKVVVLTMGTFQIMIEMGQAPHHLIDVPRFMREKDFFKESSKIFASIMLPMLLLLLVDVSIEKKKPLKELSIIYKKPTNSNVDSKNHASNNPNSKNKNNGHKSTKQPNKKVVRNKAGQKAKKAPAKKVAKTSPKKANKTKKSKAPVKAYKFKMASNVDSMFDLGKKVQVSQNRAPAAVNANSAVIGDLNTKVNGTASNKVGNLGSDVAGTQASFGSQGLSSKKGLDSSYIQTKTVVLGSMDPELLRKILRRYLPQFRHCYQQELTYNSEDIKGIVDLNFEISGNGQVAKIDIKAKDNRFSKKGIDCMSNVLSIIDFPKPKGGGKVAVRQPLNFFSEKQNS